MLKKGLLKKLGLYLVTDRSALKGKNIFQILSSSLDAGLDIVQFRDKAASDAEFLETGKKIKELTRRKKALFIINDRVDIALALDADGVHLGPEDMPVKTARKIIGKKKIIGFSAKSLEQANQTAKEDVDYIAIGAIFPTPIKPDEKAVGLEVLKKAVNKIKVPLVAIGGINEANIEDVIGCGVKRVAVVRAILCANDPYSATKTLLEKIRLSRAGV